MVKSPQIEARNKRLVLDYLDQKPISFLIREYGISETRVKQVLRQAGVSGKREPRRAHGVNERFPVVSRFHERLGRLVSEWRLDRRLESRELADLLNMTVQGTTFLQQGRRELSITEFLQVCSILKLSPSEVMEECAE